MILFYLITIAVEYVSCNYVGVRELLLSDGFDADTKDEVISRLGGLNFKQLVIPALFLILKFFGITVCLFVGNIIFKFCSLSFSQWLLIVLIVQSIPICCTGVNCAFQLLSGTIDVFDVRYDLSLMKLFEGYIPETIRDIVSPALSSIHFVELLVWTALTLVIGRMSKSKIWPSFKFVASTYGIGFLLYLSAVTLIGIIY